MREFSNRHLMKSKDKGFQIFQGDEAHISALHISLVTPAVLSEVNRRGLIACSRSYRISLPLNFTPLATSYTFDSQSIEIPQILLDTLRAHQASKSSQWRILTKVWPGPASHSDQLIANPHPSRAQHQRQARVGQ